MTVIDEYGTQQIPGNPVKKTKFGPLSRLKEKYTSYKMS
jgi:hypothetical protein